MRVTSILIATLLLCGCSNRVMSPKPWFTPADSAGAPALKTGVWVVRTKPNCRFDQRAPLERWPSCVSGLVIRDGEILELNTEPFVDAQGKTVRYAWEGRSLILAAGTPRIGQEDHCWPLPSKREDVAADESDASTAADRSTPESAVAAAPAAAASEEPAESYCYTAVEPTRADPDGAITAALVWPIVCGPWPPAAPGRERAHVTEAPFKGLQLIGDNCTAESAAAVRAAAGPSKEALASGGLRPYVAQWVRAGHR